VFADRVVLHLATHRCNTELVTFTAGPRLDLHLLTPAELFALDDADDSLFERRGLRNPHGILTSENLPRANRVADVQQNPGNMRWYYRLIVVRETRTIVGSISFHGAPDANGMVEIGLGIAPEQQGRGYATEALIGMWDWAALQPDVKTLRYTVSPDNVASQKIIAKFPAPHMGVQIDDEDGPEDIYEIPIDAYRAWRASAN
jgi:RimJ/RimL family protein N-acetyltransferase